MALLLRCSLALVLSRPLAAAPWLPQESTAGQRQQQGGDWFNEAAAAGTGAVAGTPFEAAFNSLQTATAILQWIAVEAEVSDG